MLVAISALVGVSASVGVLGVNRWADVLIVQHLLAMHGVDPGRIDGFCGPVTVWAIMTFQSTFLALPDGRIDPGGTTMQRLKKLPAEAPKTKKTGPPVAQILTMTVPRPGVTDVNFNKGVECVSNDYMKAVLGMPRDSFTQEHRPVTDPQLAKMMVTESVGPFSATGLQPAVESLRRALGEVKTKLSSVYNHLGTAGMLCCRNVRGSTSFISNHAWGTAIDFTLNKKLDEYGDGKVQIGMALLAPILNKHGWYWGAVFKKEDAMHFEAGKALVAKWGSLLPRKR